MRDSKPNKAMIDASKATQPAEHRRQRRGGIHTQGRLRNGQQPHYDVERQDGLSLLLLRSLVSTLKPIVPIYRARVTRRKRQVTQGHLGSFQSMIGVLEALLQSTQHNLLDHGVIHAPHQLLSALCLIHAYREHLNAENSRALDGYLEAALNRITLKASKAADTLATPDDGRTALLNLLREIGFPVVGSFKITQSIEQIDKPLAAVAYRVYRALRTQRRGKRYAGLHLFGKSARETQPTLSSCLMPMQNAMMQASGVAASTEAADELRALEQDYNSAKLQLIQSLAQYDTLICSETPTEAIQIHEGPSA